MTTRRVGPPDWNSFTPASVQNEDVLEQFTQLIEKFDRGTVRIEDAITTANQRIEELKDSIQHNRPLALKALCLLLRLKIESIQVFLSSCFSGADKIQREGSIGPIWSFLAAGAKSVIASHWRVPESDLTLEMVKTFYQHALDLGVKKVSKAEALRQAMLMAIKRERENPNLWGSFFLAGLK